MIRDLNIPNMSLQRKLYGRMENLKKTALMPSLMRLSRQTWTQRRKVPAGCSHYVRCNSWHKSSKISLHFTLWYESSLQL